MCSPTGGMLFTCASHISSLLHCYNLVQAKAAMLCCDASSCCLDCCWLASATLHFCQLALLPGADHWQGSKTYPYAQGPFAAGEQTLGDGILHQLAQTTHYWWCWLAIGVTLAYIFLLNVLIVMFLAVLPRELHDQIAAECSAP